jgi:hypothetical protein
MHLICILGEYAVNDVFRFVGLFPLLGSRQSVLTNMEELCCLEASTFWILFSSSYTRGIQFLSQFVACRLPCTMASLSVFMCLFVFVCVYLNTVYYREFLACEKVG